MRGAHASILLDSMSAFVGLLEPAGRLIEANRASLDAAGVERRAVIGQPFWTTAWWRGLAGAQARLRASVAEASRGTFVRYDVEHWGHRGAEFVVVDFSLSPVRDPRGRVVRLVAEGRDITARKRVETEAIRRVSELELANRRLEAERERREDFLRAASHDLRSPMQALLLEAGRLQHRLRDPSQESERRSADRIAGAAGKMTAMLNDLAESGRLEHGPIELSRAPVPLDAFASRLLSASLGAAEASRIRLELPPDLPAADADPARLERIFLNLVGNALKYSAGEIRVRAAMRGAELCVSVSDAGPGIAPEDLPHVFERYYRGRQDAERDGLGLGLFIVRMLVEAHGGRVWAESGPEGSTFSFTIPAAR